MDKKIRDKLLEISDQILELADEVKKTEEVRHDLGYVEGIGNLRASAVDTASYIKWLMLGEIFILKVVGNDSQYFKEFQQVHDAQQLVFNTRNIDAGVKILRELRGDIERNEL